MFSPLKFSGLLALVATTTTALQIETPSGLMSASQATIKWTNEVNDPTTWSFYLINTLFNNAFGLANNVDPAAGSLTLTLPVVPAADGYTWQAVNLANVTDVYASSGSFSIGSLLSSTASGSSSTSASGSASGSKTSSGSASASKSSTASGSTSSLSTSTSAIPTLSRTSTSGTASSSSASATSSTTAFNGASSLSVGAGAAIVVLAVAGGIL